MQIRLKNMALGTNAKGEKVIQPNNVRLTARRVTSGFEAHGMYYSEDAAEEIVEVETVESDKS